MTAETKTAATIPVWAGSAEPRVGASARQRLLRAAVDEFTSRGALTVTLEDVRRAAGVSVGALYHHFPDKAALARAAYDEILGSFQEGFLGVLRAQPDAESAIKEGVRFHLRWVSSNRSAAAFLLAGRPEGAERLQRNRRFFAETLAWWDTHVHYGALRPLPFDLINALWLGPAQEYTRHWLAGRARRVPSAIADELAEAAWLTVREVR
jgi:AcrR family transcriptional regulator